MLSARHLLIHVLLLIFERATCFNPELRPEKYLTISSTLNFTFKIRMNSTQPIYPGAKLLIDFSNSLIVAQEGSLNSCRFENIINPDLNVVYKDCSCKAGVCSFSISNKITESDRFFTLYFGDMKNPPYLMDQLINIRLEYDSTGLAVDEIKNFLLPKSLFKQGDIVLCGLVQSSYKVRDTAVYTFSFSPSNKIFRKGKINLFFPPEIKLASSLNVSVRLSDQDPVITLSLNSNPSDRLTLDTLFVNNDFESMPQRHIAISVEGVKNPDVISSAAISISTVTAENFLIDQMLNAFYGKATEAGNINITIDEIGASRTINAKSNLAFKIYHQCTDNLKTLIITFPNGFKYLDNTYCDPAFGLFHNGCQRQNNVFSTDNFGVYSSEIEIDVFNVVNPNTTKYVSFVVTFLNYDNLIFCQSTNSWYSFPDFLDPPSVRRNSSELNVPVEMLFSFHNKNPFDSGSLLKVVLPGGYFSLDSSKNISLKGFSETAPPLPINFTFFSYSKNEGATLILPEWCTSYIGLNYCPANSFLKFSISSGIINPSAIQSQALAALNVSLLTSDNQGMIDTFQGVLDLQPPLILDSFQAFSCVRSGSLIVGQRSSVEISFPVKKFYFQSNTNFIIMTFPQDAILLLENEITCSAEIKETKSPLQIICKPAFVNVKMGLPMLLKIEIRLECNQLCFSMLPEQSTLVVLLSQIRNPISLGPIIFSEAGSFFSLEIKNSDNNSIAYSKFLKFAEEELSPELIVGTKIFSDSNFTGVLSNFTIEFPIPVEIPLESAGGSIQISTPAQLEINDAINHVYCEANLVSSTIPFRCSFDSANKIMSIFHSFADLKQIKGQRIRIRIFSIHNPISLRGTDDFLITAAYNGYLIFYGKSAFQASENSPLKIKYATRSDTGPGVIVDFLMGLENFNPIPRNGLIHIILPKELLILTSGLTVEYKICSGLWASTDAIMNENSSSYSISLVALDCPCARQSLIDIRIPNAVNPPSEKTSNSYLLAESKDEFNFPIDKSFEKAQVLPLVKAGSVKIADLLIDNPETNSELSLFINFQMQFGVPSNTNMSLSFQEDIFFPSLSRLVCYLLASKEEIGCTPQISQGKFGYSINKITFQSVCGKAQGCLSDSLISLKISGLMSAPSTEILFSDWIIVIEHPEGGAINKGLLVNRSLSPSKPKSINRINISRSSDIVSEETSVILIYETEGVYTDATVLDLTLPADYFQINDSSKMCNSNIPCKLTLNAEENVIQARVGNICNSTNLCSGRRFVLLKIENLRNHYFISENAFTLNFTVKPSEASQAIIETGQYAGILTLEPSLIENLEVLNFEKRACRQSSFEISLFTPSFAGPGGFLKIKIEGDFFGVFGAYTRCLFYSEKNMNTKLQCMISDFSEGKTLQSFYESEMPQNSRVFFQITNTFNKDFLPAKTSTFSLIVEQYSQNNQMISKGWFSFQTQKFLTVNTLSAENIKISRKETKLGVESALYFELRFEFGLRNNSLIDAFIPKTQLDFNDLSKISCNYYNGYLFLLHPCVMAAFNQSLYNLQIFIDFRPAENSREPFTLLLKLEGGRNPILKMFNDGYGFFFKTSWNSFSVHESQQIFAFPELTAPEGLAILSVTRQTPFTKALNQTYNVSFLAKTPVMQENRFLLEFPPRLLYLDCDFAAEILLDSLPLPQDVLALQTERDQLGDSYLKSIILPTFCQKAICVSEDQHLITIKNIKNPEFLPSNLLQAKYKARMLSANSSIVSEGEYCEMGVSPELEILDLVKKSLVSRAPETAMRKTDVFFNISLKFELRSKIFITLDIPRDSLSGEGAVVLAPDPDIKISNQSIVSTNGQTWKLAFEYENKFPQAELVFTVKGGLNPPEKKNISDSNLLMTVGNLLGDIYAKAEKLSITPSVASIGQLKYFNIIRSGSSVNQDVEYAVSFEWTDNSKEILSASIAFPESIAFSPQSGVKVLNLSSNELVSSKVTFFELDNSVKLVELSTISCSPTFNISISAKNPTNTRDALKNKSIKIAVFLNDGSLFEAEFSTFFLPEIEPGVISIVDFNSSSYRVGGKPVDLSFKTKTGVSLSPNRALFVKTTEYVNISEIECYVEPEEDLFCIKDASNSQLKISTGNSSMVKFEIKFVLIGFSNPLDTSSYPLLQLFFEERLNDSYFLIDKLPFVFYYSAKEAGNLDPAIILRDNSAIGSDSQFTFLFQTQSEIPKYGKINVEFDASEQACYNGAKPILCTELSGGGKPANCSFEPPGRIILWDLCFSGNRAKGSNFSINIIGLQNCQFSPILTSSTSFKIFTSSFEEDHLIDISGAGLFASPPVFPETLAVENMTRTERKVGRETDFSVSLRINYAPLQASNIISIKFSKFLFKITSEGDQKAFINSKEITNKSIDFYEDNSIFQIKIRANSSDVADSKGRLIISLTKLKNLEYISSFAEQLMEIAIFTSNSKGDFRTSHEFTTKRLFDYIFSPVPEAIDGFAVNIYPPFAGMKANLTVSFHLQRPSLLSQASELVLDIPESFCQEGENFQCIAIQGIDKSISCSNELSRMIFRVTTAGLLEESRFIKVQMNNIITPQNPAIFTQWKLTLFYLFGDGRFEFAETLSQNASVQIFPLTSVETEICSKTCKECPKESPEICLSCKVPSSFPFLYNMSCVTKCPAGTFLEGGVCRNCADSCAECFSFDSLACLSCPQNYLFSSGKCLHSCPLGTRVSPDKQSCISEEACIEQKCLECGADGVFCSKCTSPFILNATTGSCVESCPDGFYISDALKCELCDPSCGKCQNTSADCSECSLNYFVEPFLNLASKRCQSACPDGTFPSILAGQKACRPCKSTCKTCRDASECLTCDHLNSKTAIFSYGECVEACAEGLALDKFSSSCHKKCSNPTCHRCEGADQSVCTQCFQADEEIYDGSCFEKGFCPPGWYFDQAANECQKCSQDCLSCEKKKEICLSCPKKINQNFFLFNNSCVEACPSGYAPILSQEEVWICRTDNCSSPCKSCASSPDSCLSCLDSHPLLMPKLRKCVKQCPEGHFASLIKDGTPACFPCDYSCLSCKNNLTCTACDKTSLHFPLFAFGKCVQNCEMEGLVLDSEGSVCVKKCTNNRCFRCEGDNTDICSHCAQPYNILFNNSCRSVTEVPSGFYYDLANARFEKCSDICEECSGPRDNNCLRCFENRNETLLLSGKCVAECPEGHSENTLNRLCEKNPCEGDCETCTKDKSCLGCNSKAPFFFLNACLKSCPNGTFYLASNDSTIKTCRNCSANCLSCFGAEGNCTECPLDRVLINDTCVIQCPEGFVLKDSDNSTQKCEKKNEVLPSTIFLLVLCFASVGWILVGYYKSPCILYLIMNAVIYLVSIIEFLGKAILFFSISDYYSGALAAFYLANFIFHSITGIIIKYFYIDSLFNKKIDYYSNFKRNNYLSACFLEFSLLFLGVFGLKGLNCGVLGIPESGLDRSMYFKNTTSSFIRYGLISNFLLMALDIGILIDGNRGEMSFQTAAVHLILLTILYLSHFIQFHFERKGLRL